MRRILLTLLFAVLTAPLALAQSSGYLIQPGDMLAITVLEDETLNRETLVLPDGSISVPLAGSVRAAGNSVETVERTIADRLASNFAVRPSVFVSVVTVSEEGLTFPIYVVGEVLEPGVFEVEIRHHALAGAGARRRARPLRRHQAHPAAPHRSRERPGEALHLQLPCRGARRHHPRDDQPAPGRRDRGSRTPPLRVRAMRRASLAALTLAGLAPIHGAAQDVSTLTATVSQSFEVDTNFELDDPSLGTSYFADTRLEMELAQISPGRELGLGVDTGLRALWEAEQPFEFVLASPSGAFLTYLNEGPNTAFDADLEVVSRHVDDDIDAIFDEDVPLPDDEEVTGEGYTVRYDAELGFELFPEAPSSYGVRFIGSNIDYTDDTSGTPQWVAEGQAFWQLRLNPVLSSEVRGSYLGYQADDAADTKIRVAQVDFRLIYERSENLTLGAAVGYGDREREEFGETTQSDQGPVLSGDVRYELPDFILTADGEVTAAAPDTRASFTARADYALARGTIFGRAFSRYTGAGTDVGTSIDELRVTGAGVGLTRELNSFSSVGLDFAYAHQTNLDDPDDPDIDRTELTASYSRNLTELVTAELGYTYRTRVEDPEDADSHRFFFVLGRTFETGL